MQSLPLRKCGLKFIFIAIPHFRDTVTSLAEVWIEIIIKFQINTAYHVTSLAEVWIEIEDEALEELERIRSLPLRKCGLK